MKASLSLKEDMLTKINAIVKIDLLGVSGVTEIRYDSRELNPDIFDNAINSICDTENYKRFKFHILFTNGMCLKILLD